MSLTERHRATLYQGLVAVIKDEEAVAAMLSHFPSRPGDALVTEDRLLVTEEKILVSEERLRTELHTEIGTLRAEVHAGFQRVVTWWVSSQVALLGILVAVITLAG